MASTIVCQMCFIAPPRVSKDTRSCMHQDRRPSEWKRTGPRSSVGSAGGCNDPSKSRVSPERSRPAAAHLGGGGGGAAFVCCGVRAWARGRRPDLVSSDGAPSVFHSPPGQRNRAAAPTRPGRNSLQSGGDVDRRVARIRITFLGD